MIAYPIELELGAIFLANYLVDEADAPLTVSIATGVAMDLVVVL